MSATKTITAYSARDIRIEGLTKGSPDGWSWDGDALRHSGGTVITLTADGAARLNAAVAAATTAKTESLTGAQVAALPESERDGWTFSHTYDVHGIYTRTVGRTQPGTTTLTAEHVASLANRSK